MSQTNVALVDESNFEAEVLKSPLPVLVDFGAGWCGPCRVIEPVIEKIAKARAGRVKVVRIDADASAAIATRYRVRGLPTVISFVAGQEHKRHLGASSMAVFEALLP